MNLPNKITTARFILAVIVVFLLFPYEHFNINIYRIPFAPEGVMPLIGKPDGVFPPYLGFSVLDLIACFIFVLAASTDSIDGSIARKRNLITNFGKLMDPLADKFLVNGTLIMLCFRGYTSYVNTNSQLTMSSIGIMMPALIVVFMIGRDILVDGIKMIAASNGKVIAANVYGKAKTVAQMIVIPFYILNGFPFYYIFGIYTKYLMIGLMCIVLLLSIVSGIIYAVKAKDLFKDSK